MRACVHACERADVHACEGADVLYILLKSHSMYTCTKHKYIVDIAGSMCVYHQKTIFYQQPCQCASNANAVVSDGMILF